MSPEDVARLAAAIASANGHSATDEYAAKVVEAWKALVPARREDDFKSTLSNAQQSRKEE